MDDSVILCDEVLDAEETKTILEYVTCKALNFYILLALLLITIHY